METHQFQLDQNDWVPNNARLPIVVYRQAAEQKRDVAAAAFETLFEANGWLPQWRDTVFDYHHYHSTAHEVLGAFSGSAKLMLGGPGGRLVELAAGDALVLPVGTGHCRVEATDDFRVVGAYPHGQDWDVCRDAPSLEALARIASLAVPDLDPVIGTHGPFTPKGSKQARQHV